MDARIDKAWFAPKRYGYGATPLAWQGWVAVIVFAGLLTFDIALLRGAARWGCGLVLVAGFVCVAYRKTAGAWRWRWGMRGGERLHRSDRGADTD
ncbi:MAG: hypothetical protein KGL12_06870 [Rhodospirillales bacterium]|nr:hypothetical protein [Rhodospirillales bacterium]